eukprot:365530-Chlamydomonas_euryale.AAC.9
MVKHTMQLNATIGDFIAMRGHVCAGELEYRKEAFARLQELKVRMDRAVKRAGIAERDLGTMQKDEQRMRDLVSKLTSQNAQLEALQKAEVDWAASETAPALASMPIGPLEPEDEVWLEQEYVSPEQPPVRADSTIACDPGQAGWTVKTRQCRVVRRCYRVTHWRLLAACRVRSSMVLKNTCDCRMKEHVLKHARRGCGEPAGCPWA